MRVVSSYSPQDVEGISTLYLFKLFRWITVPGTLLSSSELINHIDVYILHMWYTATCLGLFWFVSCPINMRWGCFHCIVQWWSLVLICNEEDMRICIFTFVQAADQIWNILPAITYLAPAWMLFFLFTVRLQRLHPALSLLPLYLYPRLWFIWYSLFCSSALANMQFPSGDH